MSRLLFSSIISLLLTACSFTSGRYQHANDSTPNRLPTEAELKDAIPRAEPKSRGGNKNYTVFGKSYQVLNSANGFKESGTASWYGKKFHGHLTSNGEIYDMYGMSAAHKHLPLPTYVKVTNSANNKSVIVRVNDRGPFHQGRVIDLSYSAAYKIGMLSTGTAQVTLEALTDFSPKKTSIKPIAKPNKPIVSNKTTASSSTSTTQANMVNGTYIQVFATKDQSAAKKKTQALQAALEQTVQEKVSFQQHNSVYRILIGPFTGQAEQKENTDKVIKTLQQLGYPNAYRRKILQ